MDVASISMADMNFISAFLKQVLDFIVSIVGNYGWSVVLFTLLIRMLLMPLDVKSRRSMRKTQALQPKLDALQKKYAKDKDKLNVKMQELYKAEGINPMAGCLPMLLSLPIMFMMFTAMRVTANEHTVQMLLELEQGVQPVFQSWGWIKNIFQPDSIFATVLPKFQDGLVQLQGVKGNAILTAENIVRVREFVCTPEYQAIVAQFGGGADSLLYSGSLLFWTIEIPRDFNGLCLLPLLAAGSSFLSSKITTPKSSAPAAGAQPNQTQQTSQMMMWMMPLFSLYICFSQSAAFSLYWVFANVIQIGQQLILNIYFDRQEAAKPEEVIQP